MNMTEEHFIVHVTENDYDRHYKQYIDEGFPTYEAALEHAKTKSKNVAHGRMACYEAVIYQVSRCVSVYQHPKTNEYIVTEEEVF